MITPRFSCTQTATSVLVRVYIPTVRVRACFCSSDAGPQSLTYSLTSQASDVEIHVDGTLFSLHINPYFLRLTFPGEVVEDEASSAAYDPVSGYLSVTLTKASPGHDFKDLDILAKLLAPPEHASQSLIEVIDSQNLDGLSLEENATELSRDNLSSDQKAVLEGMLLSHLLNNEISNRIMHPL